MKYIKIQFTKGLKIECYQEVDDNGCLVRYCDDEGKTIEIQDIVESYVVDEDVIPNFLK